MSSEKRINRKNISHISRSLIYLVMRMSPIGPILILSAASVFQHFNLYRANEPQLPHSVFSFYSLSDLHLNSFSILQHTFPTSFILNFTPSCKDLFTAAKHSKYLINLTLSELYSYNYIYFPRTHHYFTLIFISITFSHYTYYKIPLPAVSVHFSFGINI